MNLVVVTQQKTLCCMLTDEAATFHRFSIGLPRLSADIRSIQSDEAITSLFIDVRKGKTTNEHPRAPANNDKQSKKRRRIKARKRSQIDVLSLGFTFGSEKELADNMQKVIAAVADAAGLTPNDTIVFRSKGHEVSVLYGTIQSIMNVFLTSNNRGTETYKDFTFAEMARDYFQLPKNGSYTRGRDYVHDC